MNSISNISGRILVVQTAFIGDVVLTLPLLRAIKSFFPDSLIDFLAIPAAKNLLETVPYIDHLVIYDKRQKDKGVLQFSRLIRQLRQRQYQLALVPHRSIRSATLVFAAGIAKRVGFDRSAGRVMLTHTIKYPTGIHEINRNLHLLAPFGFDPSQRILPELFFTGEDQQAIQQWFEKQSIDEKKPSIAIAPGSVWATKRWLPEYFTTVAEKLAAAGTNIILIGGKADQDLAKKIASACSYTIYNAVGEFTLRQSAWLIRQCRLLLTNDSAPMHLAVAVQTPNIAIFGATVPALGFYPYGEKDKIMEIEALSCRPCGKHGGHKCPIGTFDCMKQILPDQVLNSINHIMKHKPEEK